MSEQSLILTVNHSFNIVLTVSIRLHPVMSNYLTNIYQTLRDHTKYFDITGLLPLMLCTAEMTYEHARLCIDINFTIEYWPLPKLPNGKVIKENYT
jgi:hypothetical protein